MIQTRSCVTSRIPFPLFGKWIHRALLTLWLFNRPFIFGSSQSLAWFPLAMPHLIQSGTWAGRVPQSHCCVPISILPWVHLTVVHYPHSLSALSFWCQCRSKWNTLRCTNRKWRTWLAPPPAINIPLWMVNSLRIVAIKSYKSYKSYKK